LKYHLSEFGDKKKKISKNMNSSR